LREHRCNHRHIRTSDPDNSMDCASRNIRVNAKMKKMSS
jgi:hypothetical protein